MRRRGRQCIRRRGSTYAAILGASVICTLLGMSAVVAMRAQVQRSSYTHDMVRAQLVARSGIEVVLQWINDRPETWRNELMGPIKTDIDGGSATVFVYDPDDADLANDPQDAAVVWAEGVFGQARRVMQVMIEPEIEPLPCLDSALTVGSDLYFPPGVRVTGNSHLFSNVNIAAFGAMINPDVRSVGAIAGWSFGGKVEQYQQPRDLPVAGAIDDWIGKAAQISIWSLPSHSGVRVVTEKLISPSHNPFGSATNDEGIYCIRCYGQPISIRDSRILGTLILDSPGPGSTIEREYLIQAAVPNYPALLVSGNITLSGSAAALSEAVEGLNFNAPGAPYNGEADDDTTDVYPCGIQGLVYVDGTLRFSGTSNSVDGVVLAESMLIDGNVQLQLDQDDRYYSDPPEGFRETARMIPVRGSWSASMP